MSDLKKQKKLLFDEFPRVSTEEWEKVIAKDLKGADYKVQLRWHTDEGINPLPFYRRENIGPLPSLKQHAPDNAWEIREIIFEQDITAADRAALLALSNGADSLQFKVNILGSNGSLGSDLSGTSIQSQDDFHQLLNSISLEKTPLHFDTRMAAPALLAMLWNEVQSQKLNRKEVHSTFTYDPFSFILERGRMPGNVDDLGKNIAQITSFAAQHLPMVRPLCVDARTFHNAGATIVQELGLAVAAASEYFSLHAQNDVDLTKAAEKIHFSFAIGSNYFLEIAKFRAIRLLWKNLIEAFGGDGEELQAYVHGETSRRNKSLYDAYTNMLRTTTEGMSAAVAGCDAITVLPFDETFRQPDRFSERIARNSQIILSEEAYFDKVADPSAGSYYIEQLTNDMAREAWKFFKEVEKTGGLLTAIKNGFVQETVEKSRLRRDQAIATRGRIFVGTNKYPNPEDEMADTFQPDRPVTSLKQTGMSINIRNDHFMPDLGKALRDGAQLGDLLSVLFDPGEENVRPLEPYKGTHAFDELRMATEKHDATPKVLCLPLGNPGVRKARSAFAANFFGCAGYQIEQPIGFETVDAALKATKAGEPDIVVICSSDKEYAALVPTICEGLDKLQKRPLVVLAGESKKNENAFREAGIDAFIHARCNVLETLKYFQSKLDIINL